MNKNKKIALAGLVFVPMLLTACGNKNKDIEVVEEFLISDEEPKTDDNNEDISEKEVLNESVNDSEDVNIENNKEVEKKEEIKEEPKKEEVKEEPKKEENKEIPKKENSSGSESDGIVLDKNPVFAKSEIPESVKTRMMGKSMTEDSTIGFEELSYLTITYLDYNGKTKQGEMVVNSKLANEVLDIFRDIYQAKFPIEKMNLIDNYGASDHASMVDNNTSAFCYRTIAGTNKVSKHGQGVAIDINPFYNPHVLKNSGTVNPPEASKYADRSLNAKGMIKKNDAVYKAFISRGWTWGGSWNNPDYQHFQKSI